LELAAPSGGVAGEAENMRFKEDAVLSAADPDLVAPFGKSDDVVAIHTESGCVLRPAGFREGEDIRVHFPSCADRVDFSGARLGAVSVGLSGPQDVTETVVGYKNCVYTFIIQRREAVPSGTGRVNDLDALARCVGRRRFGCRIPGFLGSHRFPPAVVSFSMRSVLS